MANKLIIQLTLTVLVFTLFGSCSRHKNDEQVSNEVKTLSFQLINTYPHDTASFTEGLMMRGDTLFESSGSPATYPQTRSGFGPVDLTTGKLNLKVELNRENYWAEGLTFLNDRFYLLTLTSQTGFVYAADSYEKVGEFSFLSSQGWGLTTDGKNLIMSDGTDQLSWLDTGSLLLFRKKKITQNGIPLPKLNELEEVNGTVYANLWPTNTLVKIDTATGKVTATLDLTSLANDAKRLYGHALEMNGIAYDPAAGNFLITGKFWPAIYRIKLIDPATK